MDIHSSHRTQNFATRLGECAVTYCARSVFWLLQAGEIRSFLKLGRLISSQAR